MTMANMPAMRGRRLRCVDSLQDRVGLVWKDRAGEEDMRTQEGFRGPQTGEAAVKLLPD